MGYTGKQKLRPLNIKFDLCGDPDDQEFRHELVILMIASIHELLQAGHLAVSNKNEDIFKKAAHKAKSTLVLLDDAELTRVVETFKDSVAVYSGRIDNNVGLPDINKLNELCRSIIESLEREAAMLKAQL